MKPYGRMQVSALPLLVEFGVLLSYDPWTPGGQSGGTCMAFGIESTQLRVFYIS